MPPNNYESITVPVHIKDQLEKRKHDHETWAAFFIRLFEEADEDPANIEDEDIERIADHVVTRMMTEMQ